MYQVTVDVPFQTSKSHLSYYDLMLQYISYQKKQDDMYDFVGSGEDCITDLRVLIDQHHDHQKA